MRSAASSAWRLCLAVGVGVALAACAAPARRAPAPAAEAPVLAPPLADGVQVGKARDDIRIQPLEMTFSGVRGEAGASENAAIKNVGAGPVWIATVAIEGRDRESFKLAPAPILPAWLGGGQTLSVTVRFAPPAGAAPGVHRARLRAAAGDKRGDIPQVELAGLVAAGRAPAEEPPLAAVFEALGFGASVGGAAPALGGDPAPRGDEVIIKKFRRAKTGPVGLYPVARYGADGPVPFGVYVVAGTPRRPKTTLRSLGVVAGGQHQTLNPELEIGETSFDAGEAPFGIYVQVGKQTLHGDDALNKPPRRAARVFPMSTRDGAKVSDAFVIAFDLDAEAGAAGAAGAAADFQDVVFVLWNAVAAP